MDKSPDAFRTISEVAEDLDLPQHVLRFWETRFSLIRPLKRGGGRRYYRPDDVDLLKGIRHLLYGQGYTIKGVQRILKESGPRFVQALGRGEAVALRPSEELTSAESIPEALEHEEEPGEAPSVSGAPVPSLEDGPDIRDPLVGAPTASDTAVPSPERSLSGADRERLALALAELQECRRLLGMLQLSEE